MNIYVVLRYNISSSRLKDCPEDTDFIKSLGSFSSIDKAKKYVEKFIESKEMLVI